MRSPRSAAAAHTSDASTRHLLHVMDNCERQVLEAATEVTALLGAPVPATSGPLRLKGSRVHHVTLPALPQIVLYWRGRLGSAGRPVISG